MQRKRDHRRQLQHTVLRALGKLGLGPGSWQVVDANARQIFRRVERLGYEVRLRRTNIGHADMLIASVSNTWSMRKHEYSIDLSAPNAELQCAMALFEGVACDMEG